MNIEQLEELEEQLERSLDLVRQQRRELINRQNLNKANEISIAQRSLGNTYWLSERNE